MSSGDATGAVDDFDRVLAGSETGGGDGSDTAAGLVTEPARGRSVAVAVVSTGLLGVVVIALGLLIGPPRDAPVSPTTAAPAPAPSADDGVPSADVDPPPTETDPDPDDDITSLVSAAWVDELAVPTGIPRRALLAYTGASVAVEEDYPGCGLGWNTLAGIGHVESDHARISGSELDDSGVARPSIVGIALTGETTARIPDTDGGVLDGDAVWDRAVGPMQFIPGTWKEWSADGNGDGFADPQNIDDAALAAARYLCDIGGDLTDPDRWIAAVAGYNDTVEYNNRVADAASFYASHS